MEKSKYLSKFLKLESNASSAPVEIVGDIIVVEKIKEPEKKTASGLIYGIDVKNQLGTIALDKPHWVRVLAVGAGYYKTSETDEGGTIEETIPLNVTPGDIILVGQTSVKYFSTFGELAGYEADTIGLTRESEILIRFKGEEGYNSAFEQLNRAAEGQVAEAPAAPKREDEPLF